MLYSRTQTPGTTPSTTKNVDPKLGALNPDGKSKQVNVRFDGALFEALRTYVTKPSECGAVGNDIVKNLELASNVLEHLVAEGLVPAELVNETSQALAGVDLVPAAAAKASGEEA